MNLRRAYGAALLSAALVVFPTAPPVAAADAARSGTLPGGATYLLRPVGGAPVAAIALWFRAPSAGFDPTPAPGLGRLAAAAIAASVPVTGTSLISFVERVGGRLAVTAYPQSVAVSTLVPADQAAATLQALTRAYFAPVLTDEGLATAKRDQIGESQVRAQSSEPAIQEALYGALFTDGPPRYPSFGASNAIVALPGERVRAFAERAFRPSNAVVVATGTVDDATLAAALPGRAGAARGIESAQRGVVAPAPVPVRRTGEETGFGLAWAGPPIAEEREATAMDFVADYLFSPETGNVQRAARPSGASITGTFVTFHDPGVFMITATGGDTAAARAAIDAGLAALRRPLDPATFEAARRTFVFHILSDQQTPSGLADSYGWYAVEGNPLYAPGDGGSAGRYFTAAASLTPEFVAATVAKYLGRAGASVTVVPPGVPS